MKPLEPASIGVQLQAVCNTTHFFYIFQKVPHICTSFIHDPLLRVPPIGLSISISIFSLFCLKILVYLGVMMFGQYGLGTSILFLNQPLVPSLLSVTLNLVCYLPQFWLLLQPK